MFLREPHEGEEAVRAGSRVARRCPWSFGAAPRAAWLPRLCPGCRRGCPGAAPGADAARQRWHSPRCAPGAGEARGRSASVGPGWERAAAEDLRGIGVEELCVPLVGTRGLQRRGVTCRGEKGSSRRNGAE